MKQYLDLLRHVRTTGTYKADRTGTGTYSVFGAQMRCDLSKGFPLLTTKKLFTKGIVTELLWMIGGHTNVRWLQERGVTIWDEWADEEGNLGPVYGSQWRFWPDYRKALAPLTDAVMDTASDGFVPVTHGTIDQLAEAIRTIKTNPDSRRIMVSAWNPADLPHMKLPPCHCLFQFYVVKDRLSCQLYQRSADIFLGVPFNIASYALLTHMVAGVCGLKVGDFIHTFGDLHLYANHVEQADIQLAREPKPLPHLALNPQPDIDKYTFFDVAFEDYDPHPAIKAPVVV